MWINAPTETMASACAHLGLITRGVWVEQVVVTSSSANLWEESATTCLAMSRGWLLLLSSSTIMRILGGRQVKL